jgi:hypothetical protein
MAIRLFRNEQGYAVQTECRSEEEFTRQFSVLLARLIAQDTYAGHWDAVLNAWLPQMVDICCAYRGYPMPEVTIQTRYTAGQLPTTAGVPTYSMHDEAPIPEREEPSVHVPTYSMHDEAAVPESEERGEPGAARLMRKLWQD